MTFVLMSALLVAAQTASPPARDMASPATNEKRSRPSADEPVAAEFSLKRSAVQIDAAALKWTKQRNCGSCHTTYPYLMARPSLREFPSPVPGEIRTFFENRVAHWDDPKKEAKPRWDAEVISTASALAYNDAVTSGTLHPLTRQALDRMWTLQKTDGGWEWLKCGWPPLEHDDYYGALVAALGVGHAPGDYARSAAAQPGLERLRAIFARRPHPTCTIRPFFFGPPHGSTAFWSQTRKRRPSGRCGASARRRRLVLTFAGPVEAARRIAQRPGCAQRRLRHRPGRARAPRGRSSGCRPIHPARGRLAQVSPARIGPLVHAVAQ